MERAAEAFERVFGRSATAHGAAGWQVNAAALVFEEQAGYRWASDTRGSSPFLPVMDGVACRCPQIPTTLPTLDELLGLEGISAENVHEHVLAASARGLPHGHVYTLHAELEGMQLLAVMERLIEAWRGAGQPVVAVDDVAGRLHSGSLPVHEVVWGEVAGRSGQLALQGPPLAVAR
jgi:peptidoglycan/xylan/chitin deacetylase (PgdA/CDA1 family)